MELINLIGKNMSYVLENCSDNIISYDQINRVIEMEGITVKYEANETHNALLYFDWSEEQVMTMAIFKIHHVNLIERFKLLRRYSKHNIGEYISGVTVLGSEVLVSYVRSSIIERI